jgi:TetR/AcrR family transcriptional repressor of nem operon
MKVSRKQAQENRDSVVSAASRLFRAKGFEGTGVAEVTRSAGLTHGGFYLQFPTGKEGLAVEALGHAFDERRNIWRDIAIAKPAEEAVRSIVESYLSSEHVNSPGDGCPVPALAADAARANAPVRAAFTEGVRDLLDVLSRRMPGASADARQTEAARAMAVLAGAVVLARAVDDPALAELVLQAARGERAT